VSEEATTKHPAGTPLSFDYPLLRRAICMRGEGFSRKTVAERLNVDEATLQARVSDFRRGLSTYKTRREPPTDSGQDITPEAARDGPSVPSNQSTPGSP
jgi:hypothetical protein